LSGRHCELSAAPDPFVGIIAKPIDHVGIESLENPRLPERKERPNDHGISDGVDDLDRGCALAWVRDREALERRRSIRPIPEQCGGSKRSECVPFFTRAERVAKQDDSVVATISEPALEMGILEGTRDGR